jgi:hypothetical protein
MGDVEADREIKVSVPLLIQLVWCQGASHSGRQRAFCEPETLQRFPHPQHTANTARPVGKKEIDYDESEAETERKKGNSEKCSIKEITLGGLVKRN